MRSFHCFAPFHPPASGLIRFFCLGTGSSFADFDFSFTSMLDYKPLIKSMYSNGVFNDAGEVSRENAEQYKRLFGFTSPPGLYESYGK